MTRKFKTQQLIDWGVHPDWESTDSSAVIAEEDHGMRSFECEAALIFRAPDDGKLWRVAYEYNHGAGYNSITGISEDPYEPECDELEAIQVQEVKKLVEITTYEPEQP